MSKWYSMKALAAPGEAEIDIFDEIGGYGISAKQFKASLDALGKLERINLNISSPGGSTVEGAAIYNILQASGAQITAKIFGFAASMASVIAMAADKILMPENTLLMIHNPWMATWGDAEQLRKDAELLDKIKSQLMGAYLKRTDKTESELSALLDAETWLTAKEAAGLFKNVEVVESLAVAASIRPLDIKNMPDAAKLWLKKEDVDASGENSEPSDSQTPAGAEGAASDAGALAAEYQRGVLAGRAEEALAAKLRIDDFIAKLKAESERVERLNKALNDKQSKLDRTEASNIELQGKLEQLLKGGFSFESELESWAQALAKCGGDYTKARKDYPSLYEAYMNSHPSRKNSK